MLPSPGKYSHDRYHSYQHDGVCRRRIGRGLLVHLSHTHSMLNNWIVPQRLEEGGNKGCHSAKVIEAMFG